MAKQHHLTESGVTELKTELEDLKSRRNDIAERLRIAKSEGDLSENADYTAALEEQEFVEGRINEIEEILHNATIIQSPNGNGQVKLGNTVDLENDGKQATYTVVGSLESDPGAGKISEESPIGQALLGKKVGEEVDINTPAGTSTYKITKIS